MKENEIVKSDNFQVVNFNGSKLVCPIISGMPFIVVKCIIDEVKLHQKKATGNLKNHPRLGSRVAEWRPVENGFGLSNKHAYACLPIQKVAGWLYQINLNNVSAEARPLLEIYQEKCDEVLFNHFFGGKNSVISFQQKRLPIINERRKKDAELKKAKEDLEKTSEFKTVEKLKKELSNIKRKESKIQREFFPDPQLEIKHEE